VVFDDIHFEDRRTTNGRRKGASTSVLLAASPLVDGVTGRYFEDNNEALPQGDSEYSGVAAYALDPESATRLWDVSEKLLAQQSTGLIRTPARLRSQAPGR
jgi:hypothetical protein